MSDRRQIYQPDSAALGLEKIPLYIDIHEHDVEVHRLENGILVLNKALATFIRASETVDAQFRRSEARIFSPTWKPLMKDVRGNAVQSRDVSATLATHIDQLRVGALPLISTPTIEEETVQDVRNFMDDFILNFGAVGQSIQEQAASFQALRKALTDFRTTIREPPQNANSNIESRPERSSLAQRTDINALAGGPIKRKSAFASAITKIKAVFAFTGPKPQKNFTQARSMLPEQQSGPSNYSIPVKGISAIDTSLKRISDELLNDVIAGWAVIENIHDGLESDMKQLRTYLDRTNPVDAPIPFNVYRWMGNDTRQKLMDFATGKQLTTRDSK